MTTSIETRPSASATDRFAELSAGLLASDPSVDAGRMLHAPGLRTMNGFFVFSTGSDVVVKLPARRVAALIAEGRARPCVIRRGAPLREWARLDADDERLEAIVAEALDFVRNLDRRT